MMNRQRSYVFVSFENFHPHIFFFFKQSSQCRSDIYSLTLQLKTLTNLATWWFRRVYKS